MTTIREKEIYGDVLLSIQASEEHESIPAAGDTNTPLSKYLEYEVMIIKDNTFFRPLELSQYLFNIDKKFDKEKKATLNKNQVNDLREFLINRNKEKNDDYELKNISIPADRKDTLPLPLMLKLRKCLK